jgi:hypothetical protein
MDATRIEKTIARIEAIDRGRFAEAIAARLEAGGLAADATAAITANLHDYIRAMPGLMQLIHAFAEKAGATTEMKPIIEAVERYIRQPDDEIDEQRHGLFGLLDDAYMVGKLAEQLIPAGLPLPDGFNLAAFNEFTAMILGEDIVSRLHARLLKAAAAPAPPPPVPAPVAARVGQHDPRLFGAWHHSTYYSSGGFSYSNTRSRFFGANGRYVEGAQSFVNMVHRNSSGDDIGQTAANSASPDSRGTWSTAGARLTLDADNGDSYEFRMELHADSLLLSQPGRDPTLWTRN